MLLSTACTYEIARLRLAYVCMQFDKLELFWFYGFTNQYKCNQLWYIHCRLGKEAQRPG